jgi:glyoxylate/hydroxypyruvate reductase
VNWGSPWRDGEIEDDFMRASAILLGITGWDPTGWDQRFRALAPGRDIRLWPDRVGPAAEIGYVCAWKPPHGLMTQFPNVRAIFSLGAGVDHLMGDPELPDVPIVRIVDPDLTMRMTEYVALHVLMCHRRVRLYDAQQRDHVWRDHHQPAASEVAVGVMGLGVLGRDAVAALARLGFRVAGWSRTARAVPGIETFHGAAGLEAFLARSEILVCLLPHTPATEGIIALDLLRKLKRDGALGGAFLINAGRGKLQVDADILAALDAGVLAGATLDVFPTEPLPPSSPLWSHPKVTITPHNAAASDPRSLVVNVIEQIERFERGLALANVIDRRAGY